MSRDKLLCPVPSRDKITCPKEHKNRKRTFQNRKRRSKTGKRCSKTGKRRSKTGKSCSKTEKDVPKQEKMFWNRKSLEKMPFFQRFFFRFCPAGRPGTGRDRLSKSRPVPSRGKILSLSRCPFVPGQGRNFCPVVPKSCAVPSRWKPYYRAAINATQDRQKSHGIPTVFKEYGKSSWTSFSKFRYKYWNVSSTCFIILTCTTFWFQINIYDAEDFMKGKFFAWKCMVSKG